MKKNIAALFILGTAAAVTLSVSAEEYLFKLRDDAAILCDEAVLMTEECFEDDSPIAQKLGIYTTEDISIIEKYRELGMLDFYEENAPAYLFDMPNTAEYMSNLVYGYVPLGESFDQLNINVLWELGLTGKGVTVGVIDSGVYPHNDIVANLLSGYNTYAKNNDDPASLHITTDGYGHGTMVSGLIGAAGTNYRGVAPKAKIVPIKAFNDSGSGTVKNMADGIIIAIDDYGCDVINMSCGSLSDLDTLRTAVSYAVSQNVPIIAASGNVNNSNYGTSTVGTKDAMMYPACYDGVISVGNIDRDDGLSNTSIENDYVDVVAPGKSITGLAKTVTDYRGNSGTSFACPIVTGVVACMLEAKPDLTINEIEAILHQTATDLGDAGKDFSYGYGKVNCAAIVPKILDGKMYRSNIVEHKGTYNIAIRNGFGTNKNVSAANTVDGKTTTQTHSLVYGAELCIEAPSKGILKLAYENGSGFGVYIRNATDAIYNAKLLNAHYIGNKMTALGGTNVGVSQGTSAEYPITLDNTKGVKLFLLDTSTLRADLLMNFTENSNE